VLASSDGVKTATAGIGHSLQVSGLTKRFGGLVAVKEMGFAVRAGEILGLIGPNGSGKSTVMKLIMGIERPDSGSVKIDGAEVAGLPSHRIARMGVGMVFQHSRPLHRQTVLENIKLALLPDRLTQFFADPETDAKARAIAARVGLSAVLDRRPGTLPFADLRKIEIAKAIARDPKVVLVDEPFAGLTSTETAAFSDLIAELRADGRAVLLVDHNVKSVARLVDRVLAMYVGERIAQGSAEEVMRDETVRRVYLGGELTTAARPESSFKDSATPFLEVANLGVQYGKAQALEDVSIHVHAGEFVSVVGLNGAGKTTLFNAISGLLPYSGEIRREGKPLRGRSAAAIARGGIVQCPEGRELFGDMSVRENLDLGGQHLAAAEAAKQIEWLFELFPILKVRQRQAAGTLSGGEQQMLTIARALMMKPDLLILDEPTLGLAPVILEQISKALERLRQSSNITVLLGEQNVTFALPHADRVYVLEHARIVWEGAPGKFVESVGAAYL
jgi:branched-chain amino acid transport system ATP-binding protein